jgi:hypothetical protein
MEELYRRRVIFLTDQMAHTVFDPLQEMASFGYFERVFSKDQDEIFIGDPTYSQEMRFLVEVLPEGHVFPIGQLVFPFTLIRKSLVKHHFYNIRERNSHIYELLSDILSLTGEEGIYKTEEEAVKAFLTILDECSSKPLIKDIPSFYEKFDFLGISNPPIVQPEWKKDQLQFHLFIQSLGDTELYRNIYKKLPG